MISRAPADRVITQTNMWFPVIAVCLAIMGASAHPLAVSHTSRWDGNHGGHAVGWGGQWAGGLGWGGNGWAGNGWAGNGYSSQVHHGHGWGHAGQNWGHAGQNWGHAGQNWGHAGQNWGHWPVSHVSQIGNIGHNEHWAVPNYQFAYSVSDPHTGDHKSQHESRHGDHVKGSYSLVEPDGNVRNVHYSADDHSGFNAHVSHSTAHHHIQQHHH